LLLREFNLNGIMEDGNANNKKWRVNLNLVCIEAQNNVQYDLLLFISVIRGLEAVDSDLI